MTLRKEVEFNTIVNDILKDAYFIDLKYETHHGISRMEHSLNVAKMTYRICDFFHMKKMEETTRAALLHDYFKDEEIDNFAFINHALQAAHNAEVRFHISSFEKNIIASHMFPIAKVMPKSKESLIVTLADKIAAVKECMKYKIPLTVGTLCLFFLNFCIIQR